ncbi:sugar ABC transporter substrate-binding protein [Luteimicrobium album]|uniref:sugar ABC transporter substrate-binding protein n=1 Tax=Luteimicrobium album TaxID=1054550 RepID=UPI0024E05FD4|nr:hypothetical protein [Luteimicrobium album]
MRTTIAGAGLCLAVALTASCSSDPGADEKKSGDSIVLGFSQRRLAGSDWWKTLLQGAQDRAKELGVSIEVTDAGGDTVKQNSDVDTLITKGSTRSS